MLPQSYNLDEYPDYQKVGFISASVFVSEILSAPFERVKVLLQSKPPLPINSFLYRKEFSSVIKEVTTTEGWKNLYHGLKPLLDREMFLNMAKFYGYYIGMDHIFKNREHRFFYPDVIASCIIGTSVGTFFSQALDINRLRIQGQGVGEEKAKKLDPIVKMRKVIQYKKNKGLVLPGLGINLALQNIQSVIEVVAFFNLRNALAKTQTFQSNYTINGISVIVATGLGTIISAPLDLIYTNVVFKRLNTNEASFLGCASEIMKKEGFKGLYKSYLPYFYKMVVFNLSMITLLEFFCSKVRLENKPEDEKKS